MSHSRRFLMDAGSNYLRMLATILGTVFLTKAMVSRWSVDDFGRWSLITTVMSLSLLLDLGLSNIVLKVAADRSNSNSAVILRSACMALLILSAGACIFLSLAIKLSLGSAGRSLIWVIIALSLRATVASLPWTVCRSALYARGKMSITNAVQAVNTLVYSGVACLALKRGANLSQLAAITLFFTASDSLCLIALFQHHLSDVILKPQFQPRVLRPLLSLGGASLLINLAGFVLLKTDPLIVKTFLPFSQVAMYAVALRIAENVFLLYKQLVNALTPHAIRAGLEADTRQGALIFERASRYVLALAVPVYVCALVIGRRAISLWLTPAYQQSATILSILLLAMTLSIPQLVGSNLLTFSGHHKRIATFITAGAFINVIASIIFVHFTGASGVAYGTLFTTIIIDIFLVIPFTCRVLKVELSRFGYFVLKGIALPAGVQAICLYFIQSRLHAASLAGLAAEGGLSCGGFLIAFFVLGISHGERQALVRLLGPARWLATSLVEA